MQPARSDDKVPDSHLRDYPMTSTQCLIVDLWFHPCGDRHPRTNTTEWMRFPRSTCAAVVDISIDVDIQQTGVRLDERDYQTAAGVTCRCLRNTDQFRILDRKQLRYRR